MTENNATASRAPLWPIFLTPLVAVAYYLSLKDGFRQSMVSALDLPAIFEVEFERFPHWGTHWTYRSAAEILSIGLATFLAAGICRGRERAGGFIAGAVISAGMILWYALFFYFRSQERFRDLVIPDPWYQQLTDCLVIVGAPIIGYISAELAANVNRDNSNGFGGINRLHLIWLWLPVFWYALGLIYPVVHIYFADTGDGAFSFFLKLVVYGVPAISFLVTGLVGLALLSQHVGGHLSNPIRNILGVLVLVVGFFVGVAIQFGWSALVRYVSQTLL